jgi:hypothetical protein
MAGVYSVKEFSYNVESSFAEASTTYGTRILVDSFSADLQHARIPDQAHRNRMNAGGADHKGPRIGALSFTTNLIGHQGATTGALTQTWLQDLLSDGLGGGSTAGIGRTVGVGSSATVIILNSTTGLEAGMGCRVGSVGDTRGNGQIGVIGTVDSGVQITLKNALDAAPANADQFYAMQVCHHAETGPTNYKRFAIVGTDTGNQLYMRGCQLSGLSLTFSYTDLCKAALTYGVGYWTDGTALTIPSGTTAESNYGQPAMGGSLFMQTYGTTTRQVYTPSEVEVTIGLGLEPIYGGSGTYSDQVIQGWVRTMARAQVRLRVPFDAAWSTWWGQAESAAAHWRHMVYTASASDGRAVGMYFPRVKPTGPRPIIPVESAGQNYLDVFCEAVDDETASTELTKSSWRLFMG